MSVGNENARIYLTDCGCVRIETKHFRSTMTIEKFRELAKSFKKSEQKSATEKYSLKRLSLKNNVRSGENSGFAKGKRT
jgi:hypothetical protein